MFQRDQKTTWAIDVAATTVSQFGVTLFANRSPRTDRAEPFTKEIIASVTGDPAVVSAVANIKRLQERRAQVDARCQEHEARLAGLATTKAASVEAGDIAECERSYREVSDATQALEAVKAISAEIEAKFGASVSALDLVCADVEGRARQQRVAELEKEIGRLLASLANTPLSHIGFQTIGDFLEHATALAAGRIVLGRRDQDCVMRGFPTGADRLVRAATLLGLPAAGNPTPAVGEEDDEE